MTLLSKLFPRLLAGPAAHSAAAAELEVALTESETMRRLLEERVARRRSEIAATVTLFVPPRSSPP